MVFNKRKHKLPKFPPEIRETFFRLCEALSAENVESYRVEVKNHADEQRTASKSNKFINLETLGLLEQACYRLLDLYSKLSQKQQSLAIGAIRYFALSEDPFSDEHFASGLDDDVKVMNHVLEELGLEDLIVPLH